MKVKLLLFTYLLAASSIYSQNLNYGLVFGATDYTTQNLESHSGFNGTGSKQFTPYIGAFLETSFSESLGTQIIFGFNNVSEELNFPNNTNSFFPVTSNLKTIQSSIHIKYDLDSNYDKGSYLLFGPRFTYMIKAEDDSTGSDAEYIYKQLRLGFQVGFGFSFFKHFNFMLIGDYGFTNIIAIEGLESKTIGAYGLVSVNLDSIFSKI